MTTKYVWVREYKDSEFKQYYSSKKKALNGVTISMNLSHLVYGVDSLGCKVTIQAEVLH